MKEKKKIYFRKAETQYVFPDFICKIKSLLNISTEFNPVEIIFLFLFGALERYSGLMERRANTDLENPFLQASNQLPEQETISSIEHQVFYIYCLILCCKPIERLFRFRSSLDYSMKLNLVLLSISISKVAASISVFVLSIDCIDIKSIWILLELFGDTSFCIVILMKIHLINHTNKLIPALLQLYLSTQEIRSRTYDSQDLEQPVQNEDEQNENENDLVRDSVNRRFNEILLKAKRKQKLIGLMSVAIRCFCFVLFILAQILIFHFAQIGCLSRMVDNLILSYVFLEYAFMFFPILYILLHSTIIKIRRRAMRREQMSKNRKIINKLPVNSYSSDLPGTHQCAICMLDYNKKDKLIQLSCSQMHHFHENCVKNWLEINLQCPICRARVA